MKTPSSSDKKERQQPPLGDQQRIDCTIAPQARSPAEVFPPAVAAPMVSLQEPLANYPLANNNQFSNSQLEAGGSATPHGGLRPAVYPGEQSPSAWSPSFREYMVKAGRRRRSSVEEGTAADVASSGTSRESGRKKLSERVDNVILSIVFMMLVGIVAATLIISRALVKPSPEKGADDRADKGLQLTDTPIVIPQDIGVVVRPRTPSSQTEPGETSLETNFPEYTKTFAPDKGTRYPRPPETDEESEGSWTTLVANDAPILSGGRDDGSPSAHVPHGVDTSANGTSAVNDFQEVDATPYPSQEPLEI
ncbi:hypothetical protein V5799_006988 [Amblyomma americanum]|uniref:Uncharacterized protein n=1 Tax=Amblyomma americanum TaxID=6943 RepID=A0AAQ4DUU1_AMBAM